MSCCRGPGHQYQLLNCEGSRGQAEGWPNFKGQRMCLWPLAWTVLMVVSRLLHLFLHSPACSQGRAPTRVRRGLLGFSRGAAAGPGDREAKLLWGRQTQGLCPCRPRLHSDLSLLSTRMTAKGETTWDGVCGGRGSTHPRH